MVTKYLYKDEKLIEKNSFTNDELTATTYYFYEDDKLIKLRQVTPNDFEFITEYSYEENSKTITNYDSDGISSVTTAQLDGDGNILNEVITGRDGEVFITSSYYYENNQLKKVIRNGEGVYNTTFNYEYNNIGDKVMEYNINYGDTTRLMAKFYKYEYNENLLPETMTTYEVFAPIDEEDIREY